MMMIDHDVDDVASPSNITTTTTRTVKIAQFSPSNNPEEMETSLFDRQCLHGGPVTVATIRFPPPERTTVVDQLDDPPRNDEDRYDALKSRGRVVLARGPWIESVPLFPGLHDDADSNSNGKTRSCDEESYKVLAFGGASDGSSTIENVNGMIFPSSSSSLDYLRSSPPDNSPRKRRGTSSSISVVAYGGRRISFFSGGGLWDASDKCNPRSNSRGDDFASIPITKTINEDGTAIRSSFYLELSDWIHDVRLLDTDSSDLLDAKKRIDAENSCAGSFLMAMGMANNACEIWGFRPTAQEGRREQTVLPARLQCIACDVRCMTYSLSFYGWDNESDVEDVDAGSSGNSARAPLPSLIVASGTVFGEIVVWGVVGGDSEGTRIERVARTWLSAVAENRPANCLACEIETSRVRVAPSYRLKGHLGSVFSVKFCESGNYIASTSDDRSVRLWARIPASQNDRSEHVPAFSCRTDAKKILAEQTMHTYSNIWTGWGHTARVWDVAFARSISNSQSASSHPLLVSAGEDSMARIWNPWSSKNEIARPLGGHRCESLWTVDACESIIVTGGNDGCVKLFELESRVRSKVDSVETFAVPKDPTITDQRVLGEDEEKASDQAKSRKKPKKKTKPNGQAICGMQFYACEGKLQSNLLVATRAGGLFSLDLMTHGWTDHSSWCEQVVLSSDNGKMASINPSTGSCVGVHPGGGYAVVGTTEGWLVIVSLSKQHLTKHSHKNIAFHATSYRPVQSISFIDNDSLLVFYARGSIIWFKLDELAPLRVMTLGAAGIPLSFAYDERERSMYIGDSRGNISVFDLFQSCQSMEHNSQTLREQKPTSFLAKAHGKEHVTGMTVLKSTIISVGNDGNLHYCTRDINGRLQTMISIPIPNVTGLRNVWSVSQPNGEESIILSGFYGNDFVLLDSINGYEFLRIPTGGRQRQRDFFFSFPGSKTSLRSPNIYGMANLTGQKNGCSEIDFHYSDSFGSTFTNMDISHHTGDTSQASYSIGSPVHADTINDACWVECSDSVYLLSGSNDCTVKLSKLKENKFVSVIELPPHESCVRGVCSSRRLNADSSLLVTCGGKLSMEFYIMYASPKTATYVSLLCSYRILGTTTMDHRMNAVRAIPLHPYQKRCHLVLSGDSDGNLHLCVVSEHAVERRTTIGAILQGNGRPVLCLELLHCFGKILAFVGTTGGDITVWALPGSITLDGGDAGIQCLEGLVPTSPIHVFRAHQTGVNDLSVAIGQKRGAFFTPHNSTCNDFTVIVCSVGDDQALSTCVLEFIDASQNSNGLFYVKSDRLLVMQGASASALKAVKIVPDEEFFRIYTTGHDEHITLWQLVNPSELLVKHILSSPVGTEGICVDCVRLQQSEGLVYEIIAVGGEGVELLSLDLNILHAAIKLRESNYLLITTGAGFSADSGLSTYECAPAKYRDMCNPAKLTENAHQFQQFWLNFTQSYMETKPHGGYALLNKWCHGGRLQHLKKPLSKLAYPSQSTSSPWWVYSSNVDGHFRQFKSFANSLCEIHGNCLEFKCARGIGYSNGEPRLGKEWDAWNQTIATADSCKQSTVQMNQDRLMECFNSDEILVCSHCQRPMRPNVLMFHDTDENVLREINTQRERYQTWESNIEEEVATNDGKFVILEIGCGINVPAVRQESEEVLADCEKKLRSEGTNNGSVCLIRINPKHANIEMADGDSFGWISIASKAAIALRKIDCWLKLFEFCQSAT